MNSHIQKLLPKLNKLLSNDRFSENVTNHVLGSFVLDCE